MTIGNRLGAKVASVLIAILAVLNTFCSEPLPSKVNCPPGSHTCADDPTRCCQDTTSSNFLWTIDTLGTYGTSFHDAYIVDENDIWLAGYIMIGSDAFSAFHIHGDNITAVPMRLENSYEVIFPEAIWCYADDDIWIAGGSIMHWNGTDVTTTWKLDEEWSNGVSKVWGNNDHEMYFGGKSSTIFKYDGSTLERIEKPYPDVDIFAISGTPDSNIVMFAAKTPVDEPAKSAVYKLTDAGISTLYYSENIDPDGDYGEVLGVKVLADTAYIWTIKALWKYNIYTGASSFSTDDNYQQWGHRGVWTLDGNGPNDLFAISGTTPWFHYNGNHWNYDPWLRGLDVQCYGAVISDNLVVAYGYYPASYQGFYGIGRRY